MAVRFAIASGNWSNTAIWDNGALPLPGDVVYANGFTVTLDTNATVDQLRNDSSPVFVPDIATPVMTSDNTPSGTVFYSSQQGGQAAYNAFRQDGNTTFWGSSSQAGSLGYQFSTGKVIKRYVLTTGFNANNNPRTWTFEGSNDGTTWTVLDTQTAVTFTGNTIFTGTLLANTTSYTYYRINVTITAAGQPASVGEFQMTESTGVVLGGAAGGTFSLANGISFTCTNSVALVAGTAIAVLTCSLASPNSATFNGSVSNFGGVSSGRLILLSGTGTLTLNGNYVNNSTSSAVVSFIEITAVGTLVVNGDLTLTGGASGNSSLRMINCGVSATVNINGNIVKSSVSGSNVHVIAGGATYITSASPAFVTIVGNLTCANSQNNAAMWVSNSISVTGNVVSSGAGAAILSTGGNVTVVGNVTTTNVNQGISYSGTGNIDITGTVTASSSTVAAFSSSTGLLIVRGNLVNNINGMMAVNASRLQISPAANQTWYMTTSGGADRTLYTTGLMPPSGGYPAVGDVRSGVSYGAGLYTGTCVIPAANTVALGVPVDTTFGTAVLPITVATQMWAEPVTNLTVAGSIGERLKNCATTDTTGHQIAALM